MIIYTLPDCPNCDHIKRLLQAMGFQFEDKPMDTPENLTDLRFNGCYEVMAPVLFVDGKYLNYEQAKSWIMGYEHEL